MECIDCICPLFFRARVHQTVLYLMRVSGAEQWSGRISKCLMVAFEGLPPNTYTRHKI